jgi:hypothetical protein
LRRSVGIGGLRADIPARFLDPKGEVWREIAQCAPKKNPIWLQGAAMNSEAGTLLTKRE